MQTIHVHQTVKKRGELTIRNLPVEEGQQVDAYLVIKHPSNRPRLTANKLLSSELIGLWENRKDISDSSSYARKLREEAQRRHRINEENHDYPG